MAIGNIYLPFIHQPAGHNLIATSGSYTVPAGYYARAHYSLQDGKGGVLTVNGTALVNALSSVANLNVDETLDNPAGAETWTVDSNYWFEGVVWGYNSASLAFSSTLKINGLLLAGLADGNSITEPMSLILGPGTTVSFDVGEGHDEIRIAGVERYKYEDRCAGSHQGDIWLDEADTISITYGDLIIETYPIPS